MVRCSGEAVIQSLSQRVSAGTGDVQSAVNEFREITGGVIVQAGHVREVVAAMSRITSSIREMETMVENLEAMATQLAGVAR